MEYPEAAITFGRRAAICACPTVAWRRFEQWPVGIADGEVTEERIEIFPDRVHAPFAAADPHVPSEFV